MKRKELLEVIRKLEWSQNFSDGSGPRCPYCLQKSNFGSGPHSDMCIVGQALNG